MYRDIKSSSRLQSSSPWSSRENLRSPSSPRSSPQHPPPHSPQLHPDSAANMSRKSSQSGMSGNEPIVCKFIHTK